MKNSLTGVVSTGEYVPPNTRTSKTDGGTLVWVINETTGQALSVTFVPDTFDYSDFNTPENSEASLSERSEISETNHVYVRNPMGGYPSNRIPLSVWVVNK